MKAASILRTRSLTDASSSAIKEVKLLNKSLILSVGYSQRLAVRKLGKGHDISKSYSQELNWFVPVPAASVTLTA
jgi:hypothetical protein